MMIAFYSIGHPYETTNVITATTTTSFQAQPIMSQEEQILENHDKHIKQMKSNRKNWNTVKQKHHHHLSKWKVG